MKKILLYSALFVSAMLTISSCIKDSTIENTTPEDKNGGVKLAVKLSDQTTRATDDALLQTTNIKIYKPLFEGLIREYSYAELPETIYLPATTGTDKYRVEVTAGERTKPSPAIASWSSKSYKGSAEFSVEAGKVSSTPIAIVANISNVITEVTFDTQTTTDATTGETTGGTITKVFNDDYKFTIGYENNNLEYTADKNGAEGYFIIPDGAYEPELEWEFTGTLKKKNGEAFSQTGKFVVEPSKKYKMNLVFNETDGTISFTIDIDKTTSDFDDQIEFEPTSTGIDATKKSEIWATHLPVYANVDITTYDKTKVYFEYRKKGDTAWTRTTTPATEVSAGSFSHTLTGLTPNTEYEYQLIITPSAAGSPEETVPASNTFKTAIAPVIPNASFEDYSNAEDSRYYSIYNPNSAIEANKTKWWDSGNAGSIMGSKIICNIENEKENVKKGTASIKMTSVNAVIKFAAGNLFTGEFKGTVGTAGGKVAFGRPFIGRPTKIRFWVKYNTGKVDFDDKNGGPLTENDYDIGQIKVALGTWDSNKYGGTAESPVLVNTTDTSTFVDFNTDSSTIAYGDLQITTTDGTNYTATINGETSSETGWNGWKEVIIPLEYSKLKTPPTHIIISCAASKYGDYFEGSTSSVMWVDDFELIYDHEVSKK